MKTLKKIEGTNKLVWDGVTYANLPALVKAVCPAGVSVSTVRQRLNNVNVTDEEALSTPKGGRVARFSKLTGLSDTQTAALLHNLSRPRAEWITAQ